MEDNAGASAAIQKAHTPAGSSMSADYLQHVFTNAPM